MKRKRCDILDIPEELLVMIETHLHPWDYVNFRLATNRRPNPAAMWKNKFRVITRTTNEWKYPSLTLFCWHGDTFIETYDESISCSSWSLPNLKNGRHISYVQRGGPGRQWSENINGRVEVVDQIWPDRDIRISAQLRHIENILQSLEKDENVEKK